MARVAALQKSHSNKIMKWILYERKIYFLRDWTLRYYILRETIGFLEEYDSCPKYPYVDIEIELED